MANQSAIEGSKTLLDSLASNSGQDNAVEAKIEEFIAEVQVEEGERPPFGLPPPPHPLPPTSPDHDHGDPIETIIKGFMHFKTTQFDMHPECFHELAKAQHPEFLIFACSDSRVSPSHILSFRLGKAFMARNIANLVPPFDKLRYSGVGAIIEYAVTVLNVPNIMVIGHSRCGGIERLMKYPEHDSSAPFDFVDEWLKIGIPAKNKVLHDHPNCPVEEQILICEEEAVKFSLMNLLSYPYVKERFDKRKLALWGGHYDFVNGIFKLWGPQMEHPIQIPDIPTPRTV